MAASTFTKTGTSPHAAAAEAAGLAWLREGSECVVEVFAVDDDANTLTIPRIPSARPTPEAAFRAGVELAQVHATGATAFGAPPAGWEGPNFIGRVQQDCVPTTNWADFYVHQRVLPFASQALRRGTLDEAGYAVVDKACQALLAEGQSAPVSRIHGDLWAGNLLFGPDGPHFIDPAAHGGHALTDIAMLALFGAPYFEEIVAGYQSRGELSDDWRARIPIHQLHPLAVHTLTHGSGYAGELVQAAQRTLALLG
ncbi:fructosamine kinase family protein [Corynebacterium breve]|uniref:Fructosamine kinase family protein n=1 Tax=Corynebacterium breve TaxID=3049799 RepID=A0ABY8VCQ6_9CORY|nr:fructosamine kinase family protein [Corynebacterium breve]WIM67273.1 fructosamine kinase family protein [Corynebacterium breve]